MDETDLIELRQDIEKLINSIFKCFVKITKKVESKPSIDFRDHRAPCKTEGCKFQCFSEGLCMNCLYASSNPLETQDFTPLEHVLKLHSKAKEEFEDRKKSFYI